MANWKCELINGLKHCQEILKKLVKCYQEIQIKLKLDEHWFDNEIDEVQDDIDCAAFDEETINYHLRNFYDTCDQLKVWVSL